MRLHGSVLPRRWRCSLLAKLKPPRSEKDAGEAGWQGRRMQRRLDGRKSSAQPTSSAQFRLRAEMRLEIDAPGLSSWAQQSFPGFQKTHPPPELYGRDGPQIDCLPRQEFGGGTVSAVVGSRMTRWTGRRKEAARGQGWGASSGTVKLQHGLLLLSALCVHPANTGPAFGGDQDRTMDQQRNNWTEKGL